MYVYLSSVCLPLCVYLGTDKYLSIIFVENKGPIKTMSTDLQIIMLRSIYNAVGIYANTEYYVH